MKNKLYKILAIILTLLVLDSFGSLRGIMAGGFGNRAYASTVSSMVYTFGESSSRTRTATINIPNLTSVVSVTVDAGNVDYSVNGDNVTITCMNGSSVSSYTPSQYVSGVTAHTYEDYPPSSIYYSSGSYSGTLTRYNVVNDRIGIDVEEPKSFSYTYYNSREVYYDVNGNKTGHSEFVNPQSSSVYPNGYPINQDGYVGYIPNTGGGLQSTSVIATWPNGNKKTVKEYWESWFSGTLKKVTRVWFDDYTGYYSGYIYGSTTYYYAYNVTIYYTTNLAPSVSIISPVQNQLFGLNATSFIPTVSVVDPNGDTLTCKTFIDQESTPRDIKTVSNTATAQTVSFNAIDLSVLPEGTHTVRFTVSDGQKNGEASVNIRVDKTLPVVGVFTLTSTHNEITVSGSASDNIQMHTAPYKYALNGNEVQWTSAASHTFGSLVPNTLHTVCFKARDAAGNVIEAEQDIYTKAEIPDFSITACGESFLTLSVSDSNPSGTEYLVKCGAKYVNPDGTLSDTPQWIVPAGKSISITGLDPNTDYEFQAKARNLEGVETGFGSNITGRTLALPPESLHVSDRSQSFIKLSWEASDGALGYEVDADGSLHSTGTATSFTHNGLLPETAHDYRVRVINSGGVGNWSETFTFSTLPLPPGTPAIVDTQVTRTNATISWTAVADATGYDIEVDGAIQDNGTELSYTHNNLEPDSTHTYRVRAKNEGGEGKWTGLITLVTLPDPPNPPENVSSIVTKNSILLSWEETPKTDSYQIEVDGNIIDLGGETSYFHEGLDPLTEYIYRIRGVNAGGIGEWSGYISIMTWPNEPGMPDNVMAAGDGEAITLVWFMSSDAWTYEVEINGSEIVEVAETEFHHEGLKPGTQYSYRVRAKNISGTSEWTNPVSLTATEVYTGENLAITNVSAIVNMDSITLIWDTVSDGAEYEIEADGSVIDNGFSTSFTHSDLEPGTYYDYKIRVKAGHRETWDVSITISTLPVPPEAPVITDSFATNSTIQIWWEPVTEAVSYDVEVDGEVVQGITDTTYIHENLSQGTVHEYRVRARTLLDVSPWSMALEISTSSSTYEIACTEGELFSFNLLAKDVEDFNGVTFVVTYDSEQLEVVDLCGLTPWHADLADGDIPGTNLNVKYEPGRIEYTVNASIAPGMAWSGEITSVVFRAKITDTVYIDIVEE